MQYFKSAQDERKMLKGSLKTSGETATVTQAPSDDLAELAQGILMALGKGIKIRSCFCSSVSETFLIKSQFLDIMENQILSGI